MRSSGAWEGANVADADDEFLTGVGEVVEDPGDGPIYRPAPGELQLTARAVAIGCCMGVVISAMNMYFGLKTGWGIGGSLIAAILSFAIFSALKPRKAFTPLETNIAQTAGSAAGTMTMAAGLVAAIPAVQLMDDAPQLGYVELTLWALSIAYIGVFFAVPLRRQMVIEEKLRFPTGTATANTIVAMFGSGAETVRKARALVLWAIVAGVFTVCFYFVPHLHEPPLGKWVQDATGWAGVATAAGYTFSLYVSPLLIGAGILVGMRVSVSLAAGAVVAWAILVPIVEKYEWVSPARMSYGTGARGWILWPGVAIMVFDALTALALSWKSIVRTFTRTKVSADGGGEDPHRSIPKAWWLGGLAAATVLTSFTAWYFFDIPPWMTVLAVLLSSVLAVIAVRSTGETDINPVSGVGKVTQLVYGAVAPKQVGTNLLTAGITGAGASQAADMMQDLKTGHLLGASPRKQFVAQLFGIAAGILICVPIYLLMTEAYDFGSKEMPAPSAFAWKAMADVLAQGLDALPMHAPWAVLVGALFGILVPVLRLKAPAVRPYLPSGLAFGVAFIIPAFYSFTFLIGAIVYAIWKARGRGSAEALGFAVASGLIAGEGLMGIINAVLTLLEVKPLVTLH
ncbi:MAG: OPT family oligopeptide transporter [Planctomycetota bacterium]|nr:OPT family oligopeptide transporter [Planctomycetota bacterium]